MAFPKRLPEGVDVELKDHTTTRTGDSVRHRRQAERRAFWDQHAKDGQSQKLGTYYRLRLHEVYQFVVPRGKRVLDVGCGQGNLLAAVAPSRGVGVDLSSEMITRARQRHPHLEFEHLDVHELDLDETFDYVLLSDVLNDLWDVQMVFERLQNIIEPSSRLVMNVYSHLWHIPRRAAEIAGLVKALPDQNWLTVDDLRSLLWLCDYELVRNWQEILWPVETPLIDTFCNKFLVKLWPFSEFALTNFIVARPYAPHPVAAHAKVSVVVPARNEALNIERIVERVPEMGTGTEIVFVEGGSRDDTYEVIERTVAAHPDRHCQFMRQTGVGKGDAVRLGFERASGDVLMILDADLTVQPEDLPRFFDAWQTGKGELINGVRLVYPMENEAMRFLNQVGNKFFSVAFSWLLGQPIKDTLCGTKVLSRDMYRMIAENRDYFGDLDPFGDFDLILGAAKLNLRIIDLPVRYQARTYGETNISRWQHGLLLARMLMKALRRLRFV